nr:EAL domain-containing protein [Halomonas glaciei]
MAHVKLEVDLRQAQSSQQWQLYYQPQVDHHGKITGVEARDDARDKMLALKARGVRFSLDDFGTGYSSLAYLAQPPLDQLKIDQSFVQQVLESQANAAIVESTIALAESLNLEVIAEGVEIKAQQAWLLAHDCHAYQGYLFGRPVTVEAIEKLVTGD